MDKAQRLKQIAKAREYELEEDEAVALLERELRNADADVRCAAAAAVCDYYHVPVLVQACIDLAKGDAHAGVRQRAIQSLGWILEDGALGGLEDEGGAGADLGELARDTYEAVKALLLGLARDGSRDEAVAACAVESLGWLGAQPEVQSLLEDWYRHAEPRSKASALIAAGRARLRETWEARILEHLKEKSGLLLAAALCAAGSLGLRKAAARVQELCQNPDPEVRNAAILAVPAVLPAARANRLLKSLRRHKDPDTRRMVRTAGEILEEESIFEESEEEAAETDAAAAGDTAAEEAAEAKAPEVERASIVSEFVESAAFRAAPHEQKSWLATLANHFFSFLQVHQGTDPEEFEPSDLQEFLLEFLPVNLELPPGAATAAPDGLAVLVKFMVETRRFADGEPYCEALAKVRDDYLASIGDPRPHGALAEAGDGLDSGGPGEDDADWDGPPARAGGNGKRDALAGLGGKIPAGVVKAHAHRIDGGRRRPASGSRERAGGGAAGSPGEAPGRREICPCGSGKFYGDCCGGRPRRRG